MFSDNDNAYARQRLGAARAQFDLERLASLCASNGLSVYFRSPTELERLTKLIVEKIRLQEPFSLLRIGDGEGNILSLTRPGSVPDRDLRWANAIFRIEDGKAVSLDEARDMSSALLAAIEDADIVGTRLFRPLDEEGEWDELDCAGRALEKGEIRGSVGMIDAVEMLADGLANETLKCRVLTSAWIYMHLLADLDRLLQHAERVIVISGRPVLKDIFARKCRGKPLQFVGIPVEATGGRMSSAPKHYPDHYRRVLSFLRENPSIRGSLVLVGAGFFGKVYCHAAKASGAGAIDMGSAFDLLAGLKSRPVHERLLREMRQRGVGRGIGSDNT